MKIPESLKLWERFGQYVLMATAYQDAAVLDANGCYFRDVDGNQYLDLSAGQICATLGHNHPELIRRLKAQMDQVIHTGTSFLSPVVFEASARVAGITPGKLNKVLFLSTGAEANEYAFRLAKTFTGRTGVLALTRGYAGLTLATGAATNYGKNQRPRVPDTGYVLTPDPTECPPDRQPLEWACELLAMSCEVNRALLDKVAAIIVEPILSAGGLIVLPDGYLSKLRALADDIGALLIADEAQTGMGRTGTWFGVEHDAVVPDILVLSKGVGGGFPLSAVVTTPDIADKVLGRANQFSSHQSDPLAAAAGLAVIDIIESEGLIQNARALGVYMREQLTKLAVIHSSLVNIRGRGLMVGFDVFRDPARRVAERKVGKMVEGLCRARGVHLQAIQKNRFRILPPLTIQRPDVDRFISVLDDALKAFANGKAVVDAPENQQSAAFRRGGGAQALAQWAWTHSPQTWVEKLKKSGR